MFEFSAKGLDLLNALDPAKARAAMERGLSKSLKTLGNQVKIESPVDTGRLRASITDEVRSEGKDIVGVLGSNVAYAPYMEFGTGTQTDGTGGSGSPHHPPGAALAGWARRVGANPYAVARAIGKRGGLKPRRMFRRVLESRYASTVVETQVAEEIRKAIWG